jgi:hypothetical protein
VREREEQASSNQNQREKPQQPQILRIRTEAMYFRIVDPSSRPMHSLHPRSARHDTEVETLASQTLSSKDSCGALSRHHQTMKSRKTEKFHLKQYTYLSLSAAYLYNCLKYKSQCLSGKSQVAISDNPILLPFSRLPPAVHSHTKPHN